MKTFRELDVYPRILLIVMLVMLLVFSVAYPLTISRMGFQYRGEILVPQVQENQTVYSGRVNGQKASFTVTSDGTITCQMGDKAYGPYTFREDPAALPSNAGAGVQARGVELYEGEKLLFRGGFGPFEGNVVSAGVTGGLAADENAVFTPSGTTPLASYTAHGSLAVDGSVFTSPGVYHYLVTEASSTAELLEATRAQAAQLLERYPQIPE